MSTPLPPKFRWLSSEPGPKMILEALTCYGTLEFPGDANNPQIISWAHLIGGKVEQVFKADAIPWCGLFMAVIAQRSGKQLPKDPLWALNWGTFGEAADQAMLGDTLVFVRKTNTGSQAGHVALYVAEDAQAYYTLGGNQADSVCITRMAKSRLYAIRRPVYSQMPANVRKITMSATGVLSTNEQ